MKYYVVYRKEGVNRWLLGIYASNQFARERIEELLTKNKNQSIDEYLIVEHDTESKETPREKFKRIWRDFRMYDDKLDAIHCQALHGGLEHYHKCAMLSWQYRTGISEVNYD